MKLIEMASKTKFQTDAKHESFRPKVPKHRRELSPHRYSDIEDEEEIEEEGEGQQHPQQQSPAVQTGTGLTGSQDRPDRSRQAGQFPSSS